MWYYFCTYCESTKVKSQNLLHNPSKIDSIAPAAVVHTTHITMDHQDWTTVVVRRHKGRSGAGGSAPASPFRAAGAATLRALDHGDEPVRTRSLSSESRNDIIRLRVAQTLSQSDLNARCAFPLHTIRDIEAGKLCPSPAQLNVLNRVLKTTLKFA